MWWHKVLSGLKLEYTSSLTRATLVDGMLISAGMFLKRVDDKETSAFLV